jgi:uncharacterized membrane protein HdeD (DUF308 family)
MEFVNDAPDLELVTRHWWAPVVRGALAMAFGALMILLPGAGLRALVLLFGAYALVEGIIALVGAIRGPVRAPRWGMLVLQGLASVAFGLLTLVTPVVTALALLFFIAAWAIIIGVLEILAAVRLRKHIRGEWMLGLAGLLSIVFGVVAIAIPSAGVIAVATWVGVYAIVLGGLFVGLGFRLRGIRGAERWSLSAP